MQKQIRKPQFPPHPEGSNANVTSAVGMEETAGHLRARRNSLFTQTVIWITGLVCLALLLGTLAQAWSNSQLMQRVQTTQQQFQQLQDKHTQLTKLAHYYKDPFVVESAARQQLGYVRPGEQSVIIISSNDQSQQSTPKPVARPVQQGYWQEWWNVFFGTP